jgi:hypothetical protein
MPLTLKVGFFCAQTILNNRVKIWLRTDAVAVMPARSRLKNLDTRSGASLFNVKIFKKMSKLITDSKVLMDLITEDDNLQMTIDELKDAVLTCSELCVTIEFEDFNATRQRLAKVNMTLTNMWRTLAQVKNDFKDLNTTKQ